MMKKAFIILGIMLFAIGAGLGSDLQAGGWPVDEISSIELLVVYGAGGSTDIIARQVAPVLEEVLGVTVTIRNVSGAAGLTGANYAISTGRNDGSLIFTLTTTPAYMSSHTTPDAIVFDPREITHIGRVGQWRNDLSIRMDEDRFTNWEEFLAYSKDNPGEVVVGLNGIGHTTHITMEWLAREEGIDWIMIPFDSGIENVTALAGGHIDAAASVVSWMPMADQIAPILVFDDHHIPGYEDVPTLREVGFDYSAPSLFAVSAPAGVPEERVQILQDALQKATEDERVIEAMARYEMIVDFWTSQRLAQEIDERYVELGELLREIGLAE